MKTLRIVPVLILCAGPAPAPAADFTMYLPGESRVVVSLNVRQFLDSPVVRVGTHKVYEFKVGPGETIVAAVPEEGVLLIRCGQPRASWPLRRPPVANSRCSANSLGRMNLRSVLSASLPLCHFVRAAQKCPPTATHPEIFPSLPVSGPLLGAAKLRTPGRERTPPAHGRLPPTRRAGRALCAVSDSCCPE